MIRTFAKAVFVVGSMFGGGVAWMGFCHLTGISATTAALIWVPLGLVIGVSALYMVTRNDSTGS